jgi:hypothetical protein
MGFMKNDKNFFGIFQPARNNDINLHLDNVSI